MLHLLATLGAQELIILIPLALLVFIALIAYNQGRKKGRLEGRLEEIERNKHNI